MTGGRDAASGGSRKEKVLGLYLQDEGFTTAYNVKEERSTGGKDGNRLYARNGGRYYSPMRPNTDAKADWLIYVTGRLIAHVESKNQKCGGSVAAKVVCAATELSLAKEHYLEDHGNVEMLLVVPPRHVIENMSNCDKDYFAYAKKVSLESGVLFVDDAGFHSWLVGKKLRKARKISYEFNKG